MEDIAIEIAIDEMFAKQLPNRRNHEMRNKRDFVF